MRSILFIGLFLLQNVASSAQDSYYFVTTLYFEDAKGRKDTIEIRVDTLYDFLLDPTYLEVYHPERFIADTVFAPDSTKRFEVYAIPNREVIDNEFFYLTHVIHGLQPESYHYFKNVTIDNSFNTWIDYLFLLFKCKREDMPITVTWDPSEYNNLPNAELIKYMSLMPESVAIIGPNEHWEEGINYSFYADRYQCMRFDGSWTFDLGDEEDYSVPQLKVFGFMPGVTDTLYGVLFGAFAPCSPSGLQISPTALAPLLVFPNPVTDVIHINLPKEVSGSIRIFDVLGRMMPVHSVPVATDGFDCRVSDYPTGIYTVVYQGRDRRWQTAKFQKQ
jgi:Secretion system C-terminal sorting domain